MQNCLDSNLNIANLEKRIQEILKKLEELNKVDAHDKNHKDFEKAEQSLQSLTRELGIYMQLFVYKGL